MCDDVTEVKWFRDESFGIARDGDGKDVVARVGIAVEDDGEGLRHLDNVNDHDVDVECGV